MTSPVRPSPLTAPSLRPGVTLAVDYGKKRLGLALSDELGVISRPYAVWARTNRRHDLARLRELVRREGVRRIVVGLPLHLDGTASEMSAEAQAFANRLQKTLGLPVDLMDERLSSWEARQTLPGARARGRAGMRRSGAAAGKRSSLDDAAAAVILRDYLERIRSSEDAEG